MRLMDALSATRAVLPSGTSPQPLSAWILLCESLERFGACPRLGTLPWNLLCGSEEAGYICA